MKQRNKKKIRRINIHKLRITLGPEHRRVLVPNQFPRVAQHFFLLHRRQFSMMVQSPKIFHFASYTSHPHMVLSRLIFNSEAASKTRKNKRFLCFVVRLLFNARKKRFLENIFCVLFQRFFPFFSLAFSSLVLARTRASDILLRRRCSRVGDVGMIGEW